MVTSCGLYSIALSGRRYTLRLGLYHVDFKTLKRTPKLSVEWLRNFLKGSLVGTRPPGRKFPAEAVQ